MEGVVYLLTNEAMPGFTKIGKTAVDIEKRMKELDTTGVPLPFECFHASRVPNMDFVEKQLHDAFGDQRIRQRREFFRISPERARAALLLAQLEDVTPRDDVVETPDDQSALDKARTWRSPFNFNMVDIPIGSALSFAKDEDISCTVSGAKKVVFEDQETSLSGAALIIIQRMGYNWRQVAGPSYWVFEGETLDERRRRMEEED